MISPHFLAIIPARSGSKGIPGKNIKRLCGKPLIVWSIEQALASRHIGRVVVSTDGEAIAEVAREAGADVPGLRPAELASDEAATEPTLLHVLELLKAHEGYEPRGVVLLQPTSPLRHEGAIDGAIDRFLEKGADSLLSVVPSHAFSWRGDPPEANYDYKNRPRRQDIKPEDRWYRENGSIYVTERRQLIEGGNRLCGKIVLYPMAEEAGFEIDTETDWLIMEQLMNRTFAC